MKFSEGSEARMEPGSKDSVGGEEAERIETQANTNAASRAIAVMILMLLPGVAGSYLDKWMETQFFVIIGFVLGICIAIFGLLYVAKIADIAAKKSRELRGVQPTPYIDSPSKLTQDDSGFHD